MSYQFPEPIVQDHDNPPQRKLMTYKAWPVRNEPVKNAILEIGTVIPEDANFLDQCDSFDKHAAAIVALFNAHMPQGLVDRIFAHMAIHRASSLVVSDQCQNAFAQFAEKVGKAMRNLTDDEQSQLIEAACEAEEAGLIPDNETITDPRTYQVRYAVRHETHGWFTKKDNLHQQRWMHNLKHAMLSVEWIAIRDPRCTTHQVWLYEDGEREDKGPAAPPTGDG